MSSKHSRTLKRLYAMLNRFIGMKLNNIPKPALLTMRIITVLIWCGVIAFCIVNRDRFTIDGVVGSAPDDTVPAVLLMLLLFALKSMSLFIYCGILYVASGMLFPLGLAIAVNIMGTAIMLSLPYCIGRLTGADAVGRIIEKYPKAQSLKRLRRKNDFAFSFISRAINILPADVVSLYMGAVGVRYIPYLSGGLLGFLTTIVTLPIMGTNITRPGSSEFITAAIIQISVSVVFLTICAAYKRRHQIQENEANDLKNVGGKDDENRFD